MLFPKPLFYFSLLVCLLLLVTSTGGLTISNFYKLESANWQAQSIGQDFIDLFLIAPVLAISSILAFKNNRPAVYVWGGTMLYLVYTFVIFCFDVHFNTFFPLYCLVLGIVFYSFIYFLKRIIGDSEIPIKINNGLRKFLGLYFIFISVVFYFLWLSEIIPGLVNDRMPITLVEAGLFTNPVHVLDLAIILPGIFWTGVLILKNNSFGKKLVPVILTFFVLMDITIGLLVVFMKNKGLAEDNTVANIMAVLALLSIFILFKFFRTNEVSSQIH